MTHADPASRHPSSKAIELEQNVQVRYWTQRLAISRHALDLAVQAVGNDARNVERFVRRARGRCSAGARQETLSLAVDAVPARAGAPAGCVLAGPDDILRLQYVSRAAPELDPAQLRDISQQATTFNARAGITGALLATGKHFSQVIEGPPAAVRQLMDSIARDARHRAVRTLYECQARQRRFGTWAMMLVEDAGLDDLVEELWWAQRVDPARATRLMQHLLYRLGWEPGGDKAARPPS